MGKPNNDDIETRANLILEYMKKNRRFCTKEELQQVIQCSERIVRDCINWLRNHNKMIVSVSSQKGYKLIRKSDATKKDIEWVKIMWMELDNRIKELESVREICIRCWNFYENVIWNEPLIKNKEGDIENDKQGNNGTTQSDTH